MASGDLRYIEIVSEQRLNASQRTDLGALLSSLWGGRPADLREVVFVVRDGQVFCSIRGEQTKAPSQVPIGSRITGRIP